MTVEVVTTPDSYSLIIVNGWANVPDEYMYETMPSFDTRAEAEAWAQARVADAIASITSPVQWYPQYMVTASTGFIGASQDKPDPLPFNPDNASS